MSNDTIMALFGIGFIILLIWAALWEPSEKSKERRRRQERLEMEHQLELQRLEQEQERLERQAEEEQMIPSGRGKVFKAKR